METIKHLFHVERHEINYLRLIIESYDGMAVLKTVDPHRAIIELCVAPGCQTLVFELLNSLKTLEGVKIDRYYPAPRPLVK
ncbi:DUF4911 domain-containing protein [Thermodesulfobacteriota bacterium]